MNIPTQKINQLLPKLIIVLIIVGGIITFFYLEGDRFLTLESIQENRQRLLEYTNDHYLGMILVAILIYTTATALNIPSAILLSLTTGFIFGRVMGITIIVFSATMGATLVFLAARYVVADSARKRIEKSKIAQKIINRFNDDAFSYLLFLRLVPLFPFWLVNLAPAFTKVSLRTYTVATAIGIVPGSFVFANLGGSLAEIKSLNNLLSTNVIITFTLLGLFSLIPVIFKKRVNT